MNHNDINRQCAEAMGWKEGATITEVTYWFPTASSRGICLPDFLTDWNAMKLLVEYAEEEGFTWIIEGNKVCEYTVMIMLGEEVYSNEADSTTPLTAAKAFLKCFRKEKT